MKKTNKVALEAKEFAGIYTAYKFTEHKTMVFIASLGNYTPHSALEECY